ncbi:MAG: hypothetical protein U0228_27510 [Myxococcaceae bacterium]
MRNVVTLVVASVFALGCDATLKDFAPLQFAVTGENPRILNVALAPNGECRPFRAALKDLSGTRSQLPGNPERPGCAPPAWDLVSPGSHEINDGSARASLVIENPTVTLLFEDGSTWELEPHARTPTPRIGVHAGSRVQASVPPGCAAAELEAQLQAVGFQSKGEGWWVVEMQSSEISIWLQYQSICAVCEGAECVVTRENDSASALLTPW